MIELTFLWELILIEQMYQECDLCHYWYLLNKGFKFQPYVCNRCHYLFIMLGEIRSIFYHR